MNLDEWLSRTFRTFLHNRGIAQHRTEFRQFRPRKQSTTRSLVTHRHAFRQTSQGHLSIVATTINLGQRRVALLAYPQLVLLDLVGPCEVFSLANRVSRRFRPGETDPYILETLSLDSNLHLQASSGVAFNGGRGLGGCETSIDTLLIPGGFDMNPVTADAALLHWVFEMAPR